MSTVRSASLRRPTRAGTARLRQTDAELVAAIREGRNGALRTLIERYTPSLTTTVIGMLGPSAEVDDVLQDVFIRFYNSIDRFALDGSAEPYLKRIAINRALDTLRRRRRNLGRFLSRDADPSISPDPPRLDPDRLERQDRHRMVYQALGTLSDKHRSVVVLRLIEGFSTEETARILDLPYGTVLSRLSRALGKLKHTLSPASTSDLF
ncbi:MAG: sigma-70 family RNA polymerase sigma factor [Rhodothermales bacterium]